MRSYILVLCATLTALSFVGCGDQKKAAVTPENNKAFTGPEMPADARARMAEEQAKAMAKMGAGKPPQVAAPPGPK